MNRIKTKKDREKAKIKAEIARTTSEAIAQTAWIIKAIQNENNAI